LSSLYEQNFTGAQKRYDAVSYRGAQKQNRAPTFCECPVFCPKNLKHSTQILGGYAAVICSGWYKTTREPSYGVPRVSSRRGQISLPVLGVGAVTFPAGKDFMFRDKIFIFQQIAFEQPVRCSVIVRLSKAM
jgi:hypothetical protein